MKIISIFLLTIFISTRAFPYKPVDDDLNGCRVVFDDLSSKNKLDEFIACTLFNTTSSEALLRVVYRSQVRYSNILRFLIYYLALQEDSRDVHKLKQKLKNTLFDD